MHFKPKTARKLASLSALGAGMAMAVDKAEAAIVYSGPIDFRVGFHTFRHTYTTLLTQNNEEVKVVQELLRHANSRITLDLYAQAGMPNKRLAQSKLVRMVLNKGGALA